jgi:hypothetical protein
MAHVISLQWSFVWDFAIQYYNPRTNLKEGGEEYCIARIWFKDIQVRNYFKKASLTINFTYCLLGHKYTKENFPDWTDPMKSLFTWDFVIYSKKVGYYFKYNTHRGDEKFIQNFSGKTLTENTTWGICVFTVFTVLKWILKEWKMNWIQLTHVRDQWQALFYRVMNLRVLWKAGNFLDYLRD